MNKINRQYLRRIIWIFTVSLVAMIVVSNCTNYLYSSKIVKDYISEDYVQRTQQIKKDFLAESEVMENLVEYIYISDVVLNKDAFKGDNFRAYGKIRELYGFAESVNPYLSSVQYYDSDKKMLFSAGTALSEWEIQLEEILANADEIVPQKPIVRDESFYKDKELDKKKVFSYFMFSSQSLSDTSDFLVINIDFNWLDNIIYEDNVSGVAVFDENKQVLFTKGDVIPGNVYSTSINSYEGIYPRSKVINGEEYILHFEDFSGIGITMCRIGSLSKAYPEWTTYILTIIIFIIIFALIGIMIAFYVTRVVYKPIDAIYKEVATTQVGKVNEIEHIKAVLRRYSLENKEYKDKLLSEEGLVKSYSFNKIMRNSDELSEKEIERCFSYLDIPIDSNFVVVILRINKIDEEVGRGDGLISYALYNISAEIIKEIYDVESQFFMVDDVELLVNITSKEYIEKLRGCFDRISECMFTQFNAVISMSVSDVSDGIDGISQARNQALNNLKLAFNLGAGNFFASNEYAEKETEGLRTLRYEEEVKRCTSEESAIEIVDGIFERIKNLSYEESILEIIYFAKVFGERFGFSNEITQNMVNSNIEITITDVLGIVKENIHSKFAAEDGRNLGNESSADLIRAVIAFIENNFSDANLCITMVAEGVGISPRKLSRMFQDEMGMRFSEYLIDYRIQKAKEFMLNSDMSVRDISKNIGIENDTYFYKRFREKCGMTPTEFRKSNRKNNKEM